MFYNLEDILHMDYHCGFCGEKAMAVYRKGGAVAIYCPHCDKFLTGFYRNYDALSSYWKLHRYRKCAWCGRELKYDEQDFPICPDCEAGDF